MRRLIRKPEVCAITGLSPSEIDRRERAGNFPRRIKISERAVAWKSDEIEAEVERMIAAAEGQKAAG
jgi:prophage regulatory protein